MFLLDMSCIFKLLQGLYRDVKTSSNTQRIEYYDVSLNQQPHSSVTETSLPCMLSAIYILHGQYLALLNSHPKLQFLVWASFHVPVKSLGRRSFLALLQNLRGYLSVFLFNWLSKLAKSLTFRGCEFHIKITGGNVGVQIGFCCICWASL